MKVRNSLEVASLLKNMDFPLNSKIISFDVRSMYSKISVSKAISLMVELLKGLNVPQDTIEEFKKLIQVCIGKNVCLFRKSTYKFPDGLPWEDLSPAL